MTQKKRICFVIQRYGLEVNGGAEVYCRQLAEKMLPQYEVSVATTCAVDYASWHNEYPAGTAVINGVTVHRFMVDFPRSQAEFDRVNARFLTGRLTTAKQQEEWHREQGPYVPDLLDWLAANRTAYDAFLLCTYLYYPTMLGTGLVRDRAILIPMAHDEPYLALEAVKALFHQPRGLFFLTEEEQGLVRHRFANAAIPAAVGGVGIDTPERIDPDRFRRKYGLAGDYLLYVGRIDEGKGCDTMFRYWERYKALRPSPLKLVLMGKAVIPVPPRDDILPLGFVSEQDKFDGEAGARFLLLPSRFESLSLVVLESMKLGVPVLVNGDCEVLRGHCQKSNAGLYYQNYAEFACCVDRLLRPGAEYRALCANGPAYVRQNYNWEETTRRLSGLIEGLASAPAGQ